MVELLVLLKVRKANKQTNKTYIHVIFADNPVWLLKSVGIYLSVKMGTGRAKHTHKKINKE